MVWLFVIVGLLIFAPWVLVMAGVAVAALAIPFVVFFAVWGGTAWLGYQMFPDVPAIGIIGGFVLGIYVARRLVKRAMSA